jgi:DNA-directed RNA polymerase I, II, and III subunit RPABC5
MIIPVRCFSCGKVWLLKSTALLVQPLLTRLKVIGDLWERYLKLIDEGTTDGCVYSAASGCGMTGN